MEEIWKDIEGYEGLYQVSNLGRVRSVDRIITSSYPYGTKTSFLKGKIRKLSLDGQGQYLQVNLNKENKQKQFLVHRLVAQAFVSNPKYKETVNHINGIKTDNIADNLEWATRSENEKHAYRMGLASNWLKGKHGKDNYQSKVTLQIDKSTKKVLNEFYSTGEASKATNINRSDIVNCCNKKLKSAGGYIWRYKEE